MQLPQAMTTEQMINGYATQTLGAIHLMYSNKYYGQMLVLIYSAIDSMGLLDAPPTQEDASGASFKAWVKKYLLPQNASLEFDELDFWAARCAVLHTYTSKSDLSRKDKARQIQYYSGDKKSAFATAFVAAVKDIDGGKHVAAHLEDTLLAFCKGLEAFMAVLKKNCSADPAYEKRMSDVLQQYQLPA